MTPLPLPKPGSAPVSYGWWQTVTCEVNYVLDFKMWASEVFPILLGVMPIDGFTGLDLDYSANFFLLPSLVPRPLTPGLISESTWLSQLRAFTIIVSGFMAC